MKEPEFLKEDSEVQYLQKDYDYLLKYMDADFLKSKSLNEVLLELNCVILEHGFDDNMDGYVAEGEKLQSIYDNIYSFG